jgi:hypothetical protein
MALPDTMTVSKATLTSHAIMEQDRFGRFINEAQRGGDRLLEMMSDKMKDRAVRYAPKRTRRLARSIQTVILSNGREARVFSDVPYADIMESGSQPHLIHGVKANFRWKGGYFVWDDPRYGPNSRKYQNWTREGGATVRHPGTKPHLFFSRAFHETWGEARLVMRQAYHS